VRFCSSRLTGWLPEVYRNARNAALYFSVVELMPNCLAASTPSFVKQHEWKAHARRKLRISHFRRIAQQENSFCLPSHSRAILYPKLLPADRG
jgi:hypothetical protein